MTRYVGPKRPPVPEKPISLGKFWLLGPLTRGGMAEIYLARLKDSEDKTIHHGKIIALKCANPELADRPQFIRMFLREGRLALLMDHKNIIRTIETGRFKRRHYIAMEYISGKDLNQILRHCQQRNQRIPIPHAVYIAAEALAGLHHAHTRTDSAGRHINVVFRDVSPSNIRISYDGEVRILDFGIAQAALPSFTHEIGHLRGKISYMSPEQIRSMRVDARTDVFSMGIVLHEMLTTEKLFKAPTEFELMERVRNPNILPPSRLNPRVRPDLDSCVLKALSVEPEDRFPTALAFRQALEEILEEYRFEQEELGEFMHRTFSVDFLLEQERLARCRSLSETTVAFGAEEVIETTAPFHRITPSSQSAVSEGSRKDHDSSSFTRPPTAPRAEKPSSGRLKIFLLLAALMVTMAAFSVFISRTL